MMRNGDFTIISFGSSQSRRLLVSATPIPAGQEVNISTILLLYSDGSICMNGNGTETKQRRHLNGCERRIWNAEDIRKTSKICFSEKKRKSKKIHFISFLSYDWKHFFCVWFLKTKERKQKIKLFFQTHFFSNVKCDWTQPSQLRPDCTHTIYFLCILRQMILYRDVAKKRKKHSKSLSQNHISHRQIDKSVLPDWLSYENTWIFLFWSQTPKLLAKKSNVNSEIRSCDVERRHGLNIAFMPVFQRC